jgi:G:T-mismatch repair DNA endonuclease (very short patch repair protein)
MLKAQGWKIMIIWQCRIKDDQRLLSRIKLFLELDKDVI